VILPFLSHWNCTPIRVCPQWIGKYQFNRRGF
jgi:hypothetical protein